jgi:hypothetical protein
MPIGWHQGEHHFAAHTNHLQSGSNSQQALSQDRCDAKQLRVWRAKRATETCLATSSDRSWCGLALSCESLRQGEQSRSLVFRRDGRGLPALQPATSTTCANHGGAWPSRQTAFVELAFWYFFGTTNKKGPGIAAKSLISNNVLVGGAGFEPATPAV